MADSLIAPTFSGIDTFWRAPHVSLKDVPAGHVAIIGAPHDATLSTQPGTRYAPRIIRQHSCHFITQIRSAPQPEVVDVATSRRVRVPERIPLVDCGDMVVYPNDLDRTSQSLRETMRLLSERGASPIVLGGDHYITYPLVAGFGETLLARRGRRLGYLHIDGHLDAMDDNQLWGKHWHGSPTRRIAELPFVSLRNMAWLGVNGFTFGNEWDFASSHALTVLTAADVRRLGIRRCARAGPSTPPVTGSTPSTAASTSMSLLFRCRPAPGRPTSAGSHRWSS